MIQGCVVAVYDSFVKAKAAVRVLEASNYPDDHVSLVTHSLSDELKDLEPIPGDQAERQAATGAGVGGVLGMLLASPLLTVPGIGSLLLAGPVAAAGLTGAVVGGFLGSMRGWGVQEHHVENYESKVKQGALLVVATGGPRELATAKELLDETDAEEVHLHQSTSADSPEIDDAPPSP